MTLVANQPSDITDILLLFPLILDDPVVHGDFSLICDDASSIRGRLRLDRQVGTQVSYYLSN